MEKARSKDGTTIAFDQSGEGQPLVLVDGALCSRTFGPMSELAPLLADTFTVFTYDRRGRGDSGETPPYAIEREVEDIEALIDEAGGSASVFGISSGAALALEAVASGLDIEKLALYEPPFVVDDGDGSPPDHEAKLNELIDSGRRSAAVRYFLRKMVGVPAIFVLVMRVTRTWSELKAVAHTLPYDAAIMGDRSLPTTTTPSVTGPTLVINGEESDASMHDAANALAEILPDAKHRTLDGQDHDVDPEAVAPVLTEFFDG